MIDLANEMSDAALKQDLVDGDISQLCEAADALKTEILLQREEDADAAVTITAGAGGKDSFDWTQMLANMYARWSERKRFKYVPIATVYGDPAGFRSTTFRISGEFAYSWLQGESGIHRLVRISPFDSKGKRHTSFASVLVYPMGRHGGGSSERADIDITAKDLHIDTFRSSGPGGQHVNKTESAVRITHVPTGIVVECQSGRSQIQNRAVCMDLLHARLKKAEDDKRQRERAEERDQLPDNSWGSQVRSYVLHPYQMVKDSRTGCSTSQVDSVLRGEIDQLLLSQLEQSRK
ncbi:bacterial peptide chain release factor 2 (bRF-2) [Martensiomyces pterosporus]|nr:bacterial peptide chain release factor 2 (bRF-2) [Martensiomyces pterosporus]